MLCILLRPLPKENKEEDDDTDILNKAETMDKDEVISVLNKLLGVFTKIDDPETKASLISLIGDKARLIPLQAHEVLRQLAITFTQLEIAIKMETVNLAAKLLVIRPNEVSTLTRYIFTLGFYDPDIDLRDRSRLLHQLLTSPQQSQFINNVRQRSLEFLFPNKPTVVWDGEVTHASEIVVGTFSQFFHRLIDKSSTVQEWEDPSKLPDPSVRNEVVIENPEEALQIEQDNDDDLETFFGPRKTTTTQIKTIDSSFLDEYENPDEEIIKNKPDDLFDL